MASIIDKILNQEERAQELRKQNVIVLHDFKFDNELPQTARAKYCMTYSDLTKAEESLGNLPYELSIGSK